MIPQVSPGRLHVITDETLQSRFSHAELAELAALGGADVVQFREKREWSPSRRVTTVRSMRLRLIGSEVRLIVNDDIDVALASAADGVHLGAQDSAPRSARQRLGPNSVVGATVNDLDRLRASDGKFVTYYGVGPVFGTRSKSHPAPRLGVEALASIVRESERPVIAIGNITPDRVAEVLDAGAHGVAVLSDIVCSSDPAERVSRFAAALDRAVKVS